jgi:bacteriorhodopsin
MIKESAYASLIIQFTSGIFDVYGLTIKVPEDKEIFRELLKIELGVQIVEFVYYFWMVQNISNFENITPTRYYDWFVTTPTMLITLMAYLDTTNSKNINKFIESNGQIILEVIVLNFMMLIFGLISELKGLDVKTSVALGFIPFVLYFQQIYSKYINEKTSVDQQFMYWFFVFTWSLYGVAALLPYDTKNSMYNILDLFAKNFLGVFLVYILWTNRIE